MKKEDIVKLYGSKPTYQNLVISMEEASELIQSISKLYRFGSSSERITHLIEEMADVLICFELLKILYNIPDELINLMITTKMKRNIERIDKE